jgi:hypothetical protein
MSAYTSDHLKYKYTIDEINIVDKMWVFIKDMTFDIRPYYKFRKDVIKNISKKFSFDEFKILEMMVEKTYWNCRNIIDAKFGQTMRTNIAKDIEGALNIVYDDENYHKTFINKLVVIDDHANTIYTRRFEFFDYNISICNTIMRHRDVFETLVNNPDKIEDLVSQLDINTNFHFDYPYPNLNIITPFVGSNEFRNNKIRKYFYVPNSDWGELICDY